MVPISTSRDFSSQVYEKLEFTTAPGFYELTADTTWSNVDQASWFEQARELKAEAIFFVDTFPTVLFFKLDATLHAETEAIEESIRQLHVNVWNAGRVPLFFVALPTEIRIYSAYQRPARDLQEWDPERRCLGRVQDIVDIEAAARGLQAFARPEIESGTLFWQQRTAFARQNRVDQLLLKNLCMLRDRLAGDDKTKRRYAHALIARSIFIRYLEDRQILIPEYFQETRPVHNYQRYVDFLASREATYDVLFRKLCADFNGDVFPQDDHEKEVFTDGDLHLLRDFLLGKSMDHQLDLFFWAYKFDIIPIELISSIYEAFYHEHGDDADSTHYTPLPLVKFILSHCLTSERLDAGTRVLDPACGSGVFLVEAYKRIVYHTCRRQNLDPKDLPKDELIQLLTEYIVGIDINASAIQVAAFSLYLGFLDFRNPADIRQHKQLPKLVYDPERPESGRNLFVMNAFCLTSGERAELKERIEQRGRYRGRTKDVALLQRGTWPLEDMRFDVIVGNPPWGATDDPLADTWCRCFGYPIGYKECSQYFMWRVQHLLKTGGEIGLLVSTGVLFKHEDNSKDFRQSWLRHAQVRAVYNFAHVRDVFFRKQKKDAIAPFAAVFFAPVQEDEALEHSITYVAVKQSALVEQLQAVIIDQTDLHKARQSEFIANDWLWKAYMWGKPGDIELIGELKSCYRTLFDVVGASGRGYEDGGGPRRYSTHALGADFELPTDLFYTRMPLTHLITPITHRMIYRLGEVDVYHGPRLLVRRGIRRSGEKSGEIQARLAYEPFAFKNSLIGFRLDALSEQEQQVLLGIMLSSLTKYYHFLTCSTWGFWHDEIHVDEYLQTPVHFPESQDVQQRIVDAVQRMRAAHHEPSVLDDTSQNWQTVQHALDEAIFELYDLSEPQKDLVRDLTQVTLEFFYAGNASQAARPPTVEQLEAYCGDFLDVWDDRLAARGKALQPGIYLPNHSPLCAVVFELKQIGTASAQAPRMNDAEWRYWLRQLKETTLKKYAEHIYVSRVIKELTASSMLIIKRAERRFWTKSQARQDAQELLTEVFKLEWQRNKIAAQ